MPWYKLRRGADAPRLLFIIAGLLTLAACGPSAPQIVDTSVVEEPLDLVLRPVFNRPESGPRRPVSADVVLKTEAEARALLGQPATLRREPPGEVWQYLAESPRCTLLLFLYPDEKPAAGEAPGRLRVTHAQVLSRARGQTVDDSECLGALLKTPVPSVESGPSVDSAPSGETAPAS